MCYASYRTAIEEEVSARTRRREQFTAHTITRALRDRGFREPHVVLKEVVHCLFRYGKMPKTYRRTFVRLENGHEAFVFHHRNEIVGENSPGYQIEVRGLVFSARRGTVPNRFGIARVQLSVTER